MGSAIEAQRPLQGLGDPCRAQRARLDAAGQAPRGEQLGANRLLDLVGRARDDDQRSRRGERLAHAVVAAHAHDGIGRMHELKRVGPRHDAAPGRCLRLQSGLLLRRHERPRHDHPDEIGGAGPEARQRRQDGVQHRIPVAAAPHGRQHQRSALREPVFSTDRGRIARRRIAHDVATVMELGSNRLRNRVGLRHIVEPGPAVHHDAVVEVFESVVHAQLLPERPNASGIVHDVPQAVDEPRGGAPRLQRIQTLAKLPRGAQRLMIHQYQLRGQLLGGGPQDLTADLAEVLYGRLFFSRRLLDRPRGQTGGQLDVVAPLGQREVGRDVRLGRDVRDERRIGREDAPGDRQRAIDVPQASTILRVQQ